MPKARDFCIELANTSDYTALEKAVAAGDEETASEYASPLVEKIQELKWEVESNIMGSDLTRGASIAQKIAECLAEDKLIEQRSHFRDRLYANIERHLPALYPLYRDSRQPIGDN